MVDLRLALEPPLGHPAHELLVVLGMQHPEGQVLELGLDLGHAEPVGERRVDVERLLGDLPGFSGGRYSSVRMLCRRSASLIMSTRMSRAMATSILRKFSAWRSSREEKASLPILVTPSTRSAISAPNSRWRSSLVACGVLEDVVEEPGRHRGHVHLEVHEQAGDLERMGEVGLAGGALLALVDCSEKR